MSSRQDSRPSGRGVRETLDQLELGGDLAALVGDLLLGTKVQVSMSTLDTDEGEAYASSLDASAPSLRETWIQSAIWLLHGLCLCAARLTLIEGILSRDVRVRQEVDVVRKLYLEEQSREVVSCKEKAGMRWTVANLTSKPAFDPSAAS